MVASGFDLRKLYDRIDNLNVHSDADFTTIVFSDTILVYGSDLWLRDVSQGLMWLIEFAQDLFYNLISLDLNIRAYITLDDFEHYKLKNLDAYYGRALLRCYEKEKSIECTGVFIDNDLARYSDIFKLTKYGNDCSYVHVMQHLDDISFAYDEYPIPGELVSATGMEWWIAYLLKYLKNTYAHACDEQLPESVRLKHQNAWKMISKRHAGLTKKLVDVNFNFTEVVELDWSEPLRRIGTDEGAFG